MCSGPTGSAEIQNHEFFSGYDWAKVMVKANKPPYVPKHGDNYDPQLADEDLNPPEGKGNGQIDLGNFTYVDKSILEKI